MLLPLALLTVASTLHVTPYAPTSQTPAPIATTVGNSRVFMFTMPSSDEPVVTEPLGADDTPQVVFYFVDPAPPAFLQATPVELTDGDDAAALYDDGEGIDDDGVVVAGASYPLHTTLRSLGRWLLVLLSMVFVAALLGSVGATRRPLPLAAIAVRNPARPVPLLERLLVLACLWSPMLMLLGLLQAEREMLSSVLLCMAATGVMSSGVMLVARRRLLARLRWAMEGRLDGATADELVKAEVEPKRLVPPPGEGGPTPWFRADLLVVEPVRGAEPPSHARVALDGLVVDDETARTLVRMAMGQAPETRLTILGEATRAPADAHSASPLERVAPTQARIVSGGSGRALLVAGSPAALARRLRGESVLLAGALAGSLSAAILTLLN
jgi:hypothetical protein